LILLLISETYNSETVPSKRPPFITVRSALHDVGQLQSTQRDPDTQQLDCMNGNNTRTHHLRQEFPLKEDPLFHCNACPHWRNLCHQHPVYLENERNEPNNSNIPSPPYSSNPSYHHIFDPSLASRDFHSYSNVLSNSEAPNDWASDDVTSTSGSYTVDTSETNDFSGERSVVEISFDVNV